MKIKIFKLNSKNKTLNKEELINEIVKEAEQLQQKIIKFKQDSFFKLQEYMEISSKEYGETFSQKGNLSLTNNDGTKKICKSVNNKIILNEKIKIAKILIDKCLNKWSKGGREELKKVINIAFNVDKNGTINIQNILSLRKLNIQDDDWNKAMKIINDSIDISSSKSFIRIYKKKSTEDGWKNISLDISKL